MPPLRLSAPALVDLPNGPGSTLACLQLALLLVSDSAGRYVLMVRPPAEHDHEAKLTVEIVGLPVDAAQAVHARLGELRHRLNVYRGHVLDVSLTQMGGVVLEFGEVPRTVRDEVVLPEAVLGRVERHALGIAAHREALLRAGQHLKRGLLLYGPPGTGVTASFVKELLRRAMLESLQEKPSDPVVTATHTARALDDLLDAGQKLTRSLLGVGTDPGTLAAGGGAGATAPQVRRGWAAYAPGRFSR